MPDENEGGTTLIPLLDRLAAGDTGAADEIIDKALKRLELLARKQLKSFHIVRASHQTDDIVQQMAMRFYRTLKEVTPLTVGHLLRLASTQIRQALIDLARHERGVREGRVQVVLDPAKSLSEAGQIFEQEGEQTDDGEDTRLLREEFHEQVGKLCEEERVVFEMVYYEGLTQKDVAHALGVSESTVKRRWYDAQETLHRLLRPKS